MTCIRKTKLNYHRLQFTQSYRLEGDLHNGLSVTKELKSIETREVKKSSEKKSKKQKSNKGQTSDLAKGASKSQPSKSLQYDAAIASDAQSVSFEKTTAVGPERRDSKTEVAIADVMDEYPGQKPLFAHDTRGRVSEETKGETGQIPPAVAQFNTQVQSDSELGNLLLDDDNFIEAKDTKKSRKRSAKSKGAGTKVSGARCCFWRFCWIALRTVPRARYCVQLDKEVLPAIPSGPSLGDFVVWKGESASSAPIPAPAWSTDSGKPSRPTSLRDILKEQEKNVSSGQQHIPVPTQKSVPNPPARVGGPSWQKSVSGKPAELRIILISCISSLVPEREKKGALTKHSEAVDFREWCENECDRLIGTRDRESWLLSDPDHEFIDKFLNYKDFLPVDVFDMAFQGQNDRRVTGASTRDVTSDSVGFDQVNSSACDWGYKKEERRRVRRGRRLTLSELGFKCG
ncbi:hypothetical protein HAX54_039735 [Datura stramonium]|uniref:Uncharacterized protein n=1 Tax=Datura stramonium TaxID=4076 RepID=A0ABS8VN19_DATST|nr:hypothetical protein [Datura stramonium]